MRLLSNRFLLLMVFFCVPYAIHAEEVGLIQLWNYYEYSPRLLSSGQPTPGQLAEIAAAGVSAVINLAPVDSPDAYANEGALVSALGMGYHHIPVDWDNPPLADLEAFFIAMDDLAENRVLVHCYANARASAFVYLWRTLRAGHDDAQAREAMVEIWNLNEGYEFAKVDQWQQFVTSAQVSHSSVGRID